MRLHSLLPATLLCGGLVLAAGILPASEIYMWTEPDGTVHYGDRPTGVDAEVRRDIDSEPTDPARVQQIVEARREARAEREEAEAAQAAVAPTPEELRAEEEQRARLCTEHRERLQKFVTSRRLYRHDEDGERVYLDEEETLAARNRVQEQVEEYCSP